MAGDWPVVRLGDVVDLVTGFPFESQRYTDEATAPRLLRGDNVAQGALRWDGAKRWPAIRTAELDRYWLRAGDVILAMDRPWIEAGLKYAAVQDADLPALLVQRVARLRGTGQLHTRFLRYVIASQTFTEHVLAVQTGTAVPHISGDQIRNFEFSLPPLTEQRAIAHILGTLDDKIELNRRTNETLEAIARALFTSWFVDFDPVRAKAEGRDPGLPKHLADLFPDSFERSDLGEIPTGWRVSPVGDHMVNFDSRRVPVSGVERADRHGQYPYHGAAGVMDHVNDYLFDGTYVLVGEDGSVMDGHGMAVTQYVWGKLWVNNHAHVLQGKSAVSTEQLYLYFHFESVVPYVTGAVQPKLSQGRMNAMPFAFAGPRVCLAFAEIVQPWFAKLRANADVNATLAAVRDTLLPKLISGELRVTAFEPVAAAAPS